MKKLILLFALLPSVLFGQLRDPNLVSAMDNAVDYKRSFIADGGEMNSDNLMKSAYYFLHEQSLYDNTRLLFMPEAGIKVREDGADKLITKGYDLSGFTNDVSQATALYQPFLAYTTESSYAAYSYTETSLNHSTISVSNTETYTIIRGSCQYGDYFVDTFFDEVTDTTLSGITLEDEYLYFYMLYHGTLTADQQTKLTDWLRSWVKHESLELMYGVEWDLTSDNADLTRIGSNQLHQTLPIQSDIKRVLLADNGTVNYTLSDTSSYYDSEGNPVSLDGTDGQFMVRIPSHYFREEVEGDIKRWIFAVENIAGFTYIPEHFVSAGEANIQRSTGKLACVVNMSTDYRGGDNNSSYDGQSNTLLGRPVTSISLTDSRSAAQARGTGWITEIPTISKAWRNLIYCEFATRNIQQPINYTKTAEGFTQGGLGSGVTTASSSEWSAFNGHNPFIPVGATASLGNATGEVSVTIPDFGGAGVDRTFEVPSYRGIENPFGHIWKWWDGYNLYNDGSTFTIYERDSISGLADATSTGYSEKGTLPPSNGYIVEMNPGLLLPVSKGGSSTTYYCDYYYAGSTGWRAPLVGGHAYYGGLAGLVFVSTYYMASNTGTAVGSRLCFINQ